MQITKLEAAGHQLKVAISLFLEGDYLCSLTLAGAAEEILGVLSKRAGLPAAFDFISEHHRDDVSQKLSEEERKKVVPTLLNKARNAAKHANDEQEMHVSIEQIHPLHMIMRALPMANHFGVNIANEKRMRLWVLNHPEALQD